MGFLLLSGSAHASPASKNETPPSYVVTLTAYNAVPGQTDDVYVYSKGASTTATYTPGTSSTGTGGAVGYSAVYGNFTGD